MGTKSTLLKEKFHAKCGVLKAKVQRSGRTHKRKYLHSLVREVEAAIQRQKQGIVHRITKHLWRSLGCKTTYLRCIMFNWKVPGRALGRTFRKYLKKRFQRTNADFWQVRRIGLSWNCKILQWINLNESFRPNIISDELLLNFCAKFQR